MNTASHRRVRGAAKIRGVVLALLGLLPGSACADTGQVSFGRIVVELLVQNRFYVHLSLAVTIMIFGLIILQHALERRKQLRRAARQMNADMAGDMTSISMVSLVQFLNIEHETGVVTLHDEHSEPFAGMAL